MSETSQTVNGISKEDSLSKSWDMETEGENDHEEILLNNQGNETRDKLRSKIVERRNTLTGSEVKFLENLLIDGSDELVSNATKKLSDEDLFGGGIETIHTKDFSNRHQSLRRSEVLKKRTKSEIHDKLWRAHEGGLRVSDASSRESINRRNFNPGDLFRANAKKVMLMQKSIKNLTGYGENVFRPDVPRLNVQSPTLNTFDQTNCTSALIKEVDNQQDVFMEQPVYSNSNTPPISLANSIHSGMSDTTPIANNKTDSSFSKLSIPYIHPKKHVKNEFIHQPSTSDRCLNFQSQTSTTLTNPSKQAEQISSESMISVTSGTRDIDMNSLSQQKNPSASKSLPPLPHLPFVRNRSTSTQNLLASYERFQKRPSIRRRVVLKQTSRGDGVEMSLDLPSDNKRNIQTLPFASPGVSSEEPTSSKKGSSSLRSSSGKPLSIKNRSTSTTSISTIGSSYMPSSFDDHDLLARSFVLDASMRQNSTEILSSLLLPNKETSLSDTEVRPYLSDESLSWDDEEEDTDKPFDAWNILKDDYALAYGGGDTLPFLIFGTCADDESTKPHVLSPPLMESLKNFFPYAVAENNFWLKFSLVRDGASLHTLLQQVRGSKYTLLAIETVDGEVLGSFTSSHWRKNRGYFGNGESFLWRMRKPRSTKCHSVIDQACLESELDVYPWTGNNDMIQSLRGERLVLGGGEIDEEVLPPSPGGWSKAIKNVGVGLSVDLDLLSGFSSPCETFGNPCLAQYSSSSNGIFEMANLEVWTLTPCYSEHDAEKLELGELFLEANIQ